VLKNVKLRRDALRFLNLPVDVTHGPGPISLPVVVPSRLSVSQADDQVERAVGYVGNLTLKVPWKNLKSEPVVVVLDQVFALAQPRSATAVRVGR
jgi:hypothetical protein